MSKKSNYRSTNRSKHYLKVHLIFVCKYRKKLLLRYGDDVKQIMFDISKKYNFEIKEMEVDKDHIHMMISSKPKVSPLQIVRVLKQQSTIKMWKMSFFYIYASSYRIPINNYHIYSRNIYIIFKSGRKYYGKRHKYT